jgi:general secretion pathway protein L
MSALIVALPPQPASAATEFAYVLTHDGATVARSGAAQVSVLPPPRGGGEVVALVPATMLSWHQVELPKGSASRTPRLRAVLEGLLEDRLLDEPENLHFAVQPQLRADEPVWVATCDREWLRNALQVLQAGGREVARVVPEFAPGNPPALYALGDPEDAAMVAVTAGGVTVLPLNAVALSVLPALPEDTACIAEPAVAALAEQVLQHRPVIQQVSERWVRSAQSAWNLAQFEFSNSGQTFKRFGALWGDVVASPQWRPARWGAVLLVTLNLVGLNAWAWRERSSLETRRAEIRRTLTDTFPNVKVVVDAPVQMEREVSALRQATGASSNRDLEAILGALATALPPQRVPTALDYANGELRVRGLGLAAEEARNVSATMRSHGYSANLNGDVLVLAPGEPA